jgi:carbon-monoxide dehydrogenase small subunit
MKYPLHLSVNGERYDVEVESHHSLVDVLRNEIGLMGTKVGCEDGRCGSCTVILDGRLVKSCLTLALQANGKEVQTIEGVGAAENLHPIQEAFLDNGAVQCGYCTPAMILSVKSLLDENPHPSEEEIRRALKGVLCRCGTYTHVTRAVLSVAGK